VVDHLLLASESIVLNLAEGTRLKNIGRKQHTLDYAVGSALECAACLDIAAVKQFLTIDGAVREKRLLCEIVRMLVGLRKSWADPGLREDSSLYGNQPVAIFPHEHLDVYQRGIKLLGRIALMLRGLSAS
jgi:four helix bundle protein